MTAESDANERLTVWIYPGRLFASAKPTVATTILGTCVSVCLFDPVRQVGGMNHFTLPRAPETWSDSLKYGDVSTLQLIAEVIARGALRRNLQAKVFGGKSVGGDLEMGNLIGRNNIEVALAVLQSEGIVVTAQNLGRACSRKVVFHSDTGLALIREI